MWMKKKYAVNLEGERRHAVVARLDDETRVRVDEGDLVPVDHHPVFEGKAISIRHGRKLYLIHITGLDNQGGMVATINGRPANLQVMDELKAQALDTGPEAANGGTITAGIPGLVLDVKAEVGQRVQKGDPVIVVEAMKMQNELAATIAGTVTDIPVETGQTVNPGDVLVVIEADPED